MAENNVTPLDIAFEDLKSRVDITSVVRQKMIDKLTSSINELKLDVNEDPARLLEVKMTIFNTLDGLLKSQVDNSNTYVKAILSRKDSDTTANFQAQVAEVLRQVDMMTVPRNSAITAEERKAAEEAMEKAFADSGLAITEEELKV